MTKIYFVRHAQPVANADWPDDRMRSLTARGMAALVAVEFEWAIQGGFVTGLEEAMA